MNNASIASFIIAVIYINKLKNNKKIYKIPKIIIKFNKNLAYRIIADYLYRCGKYLFAKKYIDKIDVAKLNIHDIYLMANSLDRMGNTTEAIELLKSETMRKCPKKVWLLWSNMVYTTEQYVELKNSYRHSIKDKTIQENDIDILFYLANAALHLNLNNEIKKIGNKSLELINSSKEIYNQKNYIKKTINKKYAIKTLLDIKSVLDMNKVPFFLVSGTLLGCIRDSSIIKNDNDLDLGVFDNVEYMLIYNIFKKLPMYEILSKPNPDCIRIRSITGICADIFFHHITDKQTIEHRGVKCKWVNSYFSLIKHEFLGQEFQIPDSYIIYLNENYGENWSIQSKYFDSAVDTPNAIVLHKGYLFIHCIKQVLINKNSSSLERYRKLVKKYEIL